MPFQAPLGGDIPPAFEPGGKPPGRPGGGPPGGGPGGGPIVGPSGGFGGSGIDPQLLRILSGFGDSVPIMGRRQFQAKPMGPSVPGRTDTVPALLTPGEMVMNTGVTQQPGIAQILDQLNQQGMQQPQGFAHGGMVHGDNYCPNCGYCRGGMVPGYATGGMVPGAFGGGQPVTSFFGKKFGPQQAAGQPPAAPGSFGGNTYDQRGGVSNFNPNNPWGSQSGSHDPNVFGAGERTLGGFGQAGYFDPRGNQMLLNSMNEGAQGTADALVRRQMSQADLSGLDPAQAAVAKLQALRDTGRGVQDIMANTRAQALGNQNDFAQNLFNQLFQQNAGWYGAQQQGDISRWLQNQQNQDAKKNQWGNIAGGVLGSAAGGYFGGRP